MAHFGNDSRDLTLLAEAAAWPELQELDQLTPEAMQDIASQQGIDFATALLFDRLRRSKRHGATIAAFESIDPDEPLSPFNQPTLLAIVPGAFYRESPHTGADGKLLRDEAAQLGIRTELVPVGSFGTLAGNAQIIRDWLLRRQDQQVVLVSLSKGGAEVMRALAAEDAPRVFSPVAVWVNLSGITEYSPLADWLLRQKLRTQCIRLWFWWRGYDFNVVRDFARSEQVPWKLPHGLRTFHVVGIPLCRHLSTPLACRGHRRLAPLGPNDAGGNLLAEVVRRPGEVLPVWGADHYLQPEREGPSRLIRRVLHHACRFSAPPAAQPPLAGANS